MKSVSKIMYTIGLVTNIIAVFGLIAASMAVATVKSNADFIERIVQEYPQLTAEIVTSALGMLFTILIIALVIELLVIILGVFGIKNANSDKPNQSTFHILAIVFGLISAEVFYLLGGIFGLVAKNE